MYLNFSLEYSLKCLKALHEIACIRCYYDNQPMVFFSARVAPFKLSFVSDANEQTDATANAGNANNNESVLGVAGTAAALGTVGFSLAFEQVPCA